MQFLVAAPEIVILRIAIMPRFTCGTCDQPSEADSGYNHRHRVARDGLPEIAPSLVHMRPVIVPNLFDHIADGEFLLQRLNGLRDIAALGIDLPRKRGGGLITLRIGGGMGMPFWHIAHLNLSRAILASSESASTVRSGVRLSALS